MLIRHHTTTPSPEGARCCWLGALLGGVHRVLISETRPSVSVPDRPDPADQRPEPSPPKGVQATDDSTLKGRGWNVCYLWGYIVDSGRRTAYSTFLIFAIAIAVALIVGCVLLLLSTPEVPAHIGLPKPGAEFVGGAGLSSAVVVVIAVIRWLRRRGGDGTPG